MHDMMALELSNETDSESEIVDAIEKEDVAKLRQLLEQETPLKDKGGYYLLAVIENFVKGKEEHKNLNIVQELLSFGADPLAKIEYDGFNTNPLRFAFECKKNESLVTILLNHLEQSNRFTEIALMDAARCEDPNQILFLINKGVYKEAEYAVCERIHWLADDDVLRIEPIQYHALKVLFEISHLPQQNVALANIYFVHTLALLYL